jgi:hypothetical protein
LSAFTGRVAATDAALAAVATVVRVRREIDAGAFALREASWTTADSGWGGWS